MHVQHDDMMHNQDSDIAAEIVRNFESWSVVAFQNQHGQSICLLSARHHSNHRKIVAGSKAHVYKPRFLCMTSQNQTLSFGIVNVVNFGW